MITASGLELRAGSRLLLGAATFRIADGDRVGLVGRNGAGKTTLTRVLAGETQPAAGEVARSGPVGYLPQDPRTGDLDVLARDRVLSARGLDEVVRGMRETEGEMASADPDTHERAMRRYARLEDRVPGRAAATPPRARRPPSPPASACPSGCWASRCARSPAGSAAGSSWPASCSPARRRRRCCSTSRPTTSTPTRSSGCATSSRATAAAWWSSATTSACSSRRSTGCSTWTPTGPSSTSTTSAGRPTWRSARPTSGAAARAGQRREAGRRAQGAGRQDAGQGDQGPGRAEHGPAGRAAAGRPRRRAAGRPGRQAALPRPGTVRRRR